MAATTKVECINTHEQLIRSGGGVAITPSYSGIGTRYFNGWAIYRVNAQGKQMITDPNAHWSEHGKRVFTTLGASGDTPAERSRLALEAAKKWVAEQGWYDGAWKRNRMRDYVPAAVNEQFPLRKG